MWDRSPAPATTNAPPYAPFAQRSRETCGEFQIQSAWNASILAPSFEASRIVIVWVRLFICHRFRGAAWLSFTRPSGDAVRDLVTDPPVNWRAIFNGPSGTPCRRVAIGYTAARRSARS